MKVIGLVLMLLGLLLAAAGPIAMWWSYQPSMMSEQIQPSDVANRISAANFIATTGIPLGISLAVGGLALFLGGLLTRDPKGKEPQG